MLIRNISTQGDLDVPLLGRVVKYGETADVEPGHAETLLAQHNNFEAADTPAALIADAHAEARDAALPAPPDTEPAPAPAADSGPADAALPAPQDYSQELQHDAAAGDADTAHAPEGM